MIKYPQLSQMGIFYLAIPSRRSWSAAMAAVAPSKTAVEISTFPSLWHALEHTRWMIKTLRSGSEGFYVVYSFFHLGGIIRLIIHYSSLMRSFAQHGRLASFMKKLVYSSSSLLLLVPSSITPAYAATHASDLCAIVLPGYQSTRLTNSKTGKYLLFPFEKNTVAWTEEPENGGAEGKLILSTSGSIRILTTKAITQTVRAAGKNLLVWLEKTSGQRTDVFFFDGETVKKLTNETEGLYQRSPSVGEDGTVAWIRINRELSVQTAEGRPPQVVFDDQRVMVYNSGTATKDVSGAGLFAAVTVLKNGRVAWAGTELAQRATEWDKNPRSGFLWDGASVKSVRLVDPAMTEWPTFNEEGVIYATQAPFGSAKYRLTSYANVTKDLGDIPGSVDPDPLNKAGGFAWTSWGRTSSRTFSWNGTVTKELTSLLPTGFDRLNQLDIHPTNSSLLVKAFTYEDGQKKAQLPTWHHQIFQYSPSSNTLTRLTQAPGLGTEQRRTGATHGWYGREGEVYWAVTTPESGYRTNDLCVARPSTSPVPASETNPSAEDEASEETSTDESCDMDALDAHQQAIFQANQTLRTRTLKAFDDQVPFRLQASLNRGRVASVRTVLNASRTTLAKELSQALKIGTGYTTNLNEEAPIPASFAIPYNRAFLKAKNVLLRYATVKDRVVIERVTKDALRQSILAYEQALRDAQKALEASDTCQDN